MEAEMRDAYDVIIVGARCAGSPLAMLLARKGYQVLVVDRATFPSDTLSTHLIHPLGVAALARWGLLERLIATGVPPIDTYAFDFGPVTIEGGPGTTEWPVSYSPRRTVLDKLLVDAAREAGAEIREGITVDKILRDGERVTGIRGHHKDGVMLSAQAKVVVGADGRYSRVAEAVGAERYHEVPAQMVPYYAYWSGVPMHGRFETYARDHRGFAAMPTHDGLTLIAAGWPIAELDAHKDDVEATYLGAIALAPEFMARLARGTRVSKFHGAATPNFFRKPYGPGWALVGDAGYLKDPITAFGMLDAFLDAERCADALDTGLRDPLRAEDALAAWQRARDERALPMFEMTCQIAALEPPPPEMQQLLGGIIGNRPAMDAFIRMNAGTISPPEFFASMMPPPPAQAALASGG